MTNSQHLKAVSKKLATVLETVVQQKAEEDPWDGHGYIDTQDGIDVVIDATINTGELVEALHHAGLLAPHPEFWKENHRLRVENHRLREELTQLETFVPRLTLHPARQSSRSHTLELAQELHQAMQKAYTHEINKILKGNQ